MRFLRAMLFVGMIGGFASGFAHLFSGDGGHCHRAPSHGPPAAAPVTP